MRRMGVVIGFCLSILIVYIIFHKRIASEKEVEDYIANSEVLVFNEVIFLNDVFAETYSYNPIKGMGSSTGFKSKSYAVFKATNHNKYFRLETYDTRTFTRTNELIRKAYFYGVVNKDDMRNPKLGSKEHPVVVLLWYTRPDSQSSSRADLQIRCQGIPHLLPRRIKSFDFTDEY